MIQAVFKWGSSKPKPPLERLEQLVKLVGDRQRGSRSGGVEGKSEGGVERGSEGCVEAGRGLGLRGLGGQQQGQGLDKHHHQHHQQQQQQQQQQPRDDKIDMDVDGDGDVDDAVGMVIDDEGDCNGDGEDDVDCYYDEFVAVWRALCTAHKDGRWVRDC